MSKSNKVTDLFSAKRIAIPIAIGFLVAGYMLWSNTSWQELSKIEFSVEMFGWLLVAVLMMVIRDLAYMYRIKVLTDNVLSWRKSFDVIMLWEFASSITPSVVGGSGVAMFILNKEGISLGKSTAVVMVTALLDELFYLITVPLVILLIGIQYLFPIELSKTIFGITLSTREIFMVGYVFILFLTLLISYGVFINPNKLKKALVAIFKLKFLKKWQVKVVKLGDDLIQTSMELKNKPFLFWVKAFGATIASWTARFWVVNFLILAVTDVSSHFLIYGRQLVMWVILLISPTPGGTGVAEFAFNGFLQNFIPIGLVGLLVVFWRLISYYPYLFVGAFVLPKWIKRVG
jgi:glycosyltransferase 2 family protein